MSSRFTHLPFLSWHRVLALPLSRQAERCSRCPLLRLTKPAYTPPAQATAATLMAAGYRKCFGSAKIIVEANESISKKFWTAASVDEKLPRSAAPTPSCIIICAQRSNDHRPSRERITPSMRVLEASRALEKVQNRRTVGRRHRIW